MSDEILEKELDETYQAIEEIDTDYKKLIRKYEDLEYEYSFLKCQYNWLKEDYRKFKGWE